MQARATQTEPWYVHLLQLGAYVIGRFAADRCVRLASALTFTALLALVPLLAVSFSIFSAFPAFDVLMVEAQEFIFDNFVPEVGPAVKQYVVTFTAQAGRLTAIGILFLAVTSILLLFSIASAFNEVWRVREGRTLVSRLLVFWAVLTLAPLFFGASLSVSSYLFAAARDIGGETVSGSIANYVWLLPMLLQVAGFTLLYMIVPNYRVSRIDALIGGLLAGVLFELLKKAFGFYVTTVPTYQTIYGTMAVVPIFLLWVYLSWLVVLIGAETTAALPEFRAGARLVRAQTRSPGGRLVAAIGILDALYKASISGGGIRMAALAAANSREPRSFVAARDLLLKRGYMQRTERGAWILARDLNSVTLYDLFADLGLDLSVQLRKGVEPSDWAPRLTNIVLECNETAQTAMDISLQELLGAGPTPDLASPAKPPTADRADPDKEGLQDRARTLLGMRD